MKTITVITHSPIEWLTENIAEYFPEFDTDSIELLMSIVVEAGVNPATRQPTLEDLSVISVAVEADELAPQIFDMIRDNFDESLVFIGDITFNMEAIL